MVEGKREENIKEGLREGSKSGIIRYTVIREDSWGGGHVNLRNCLEIYWI